ncbi:hypothetical protein [Vibrio sp. B1FLJ16]|uniref:hypothetical protein n=1 Tax=Vibrio sp. B1FLJ16 TaxID=2751178 RepID=UPI001AF7C947|nr:hypothetical protein [Vibrio sp. B1FLJ16]CAD7798487.1 hypothetical protein ACOMICROBIO_EPCKBFOG_00351 [Vibrio sp. B1FLJ16]CAE6883830.1 hypothetical protein ACOMICROBIO_EPCKBFOG_00351 [Vibrio sp. B1FLJ16]
MSEGLTQYHRTINIKTQPRITPKSTSKITSPYYQHDFTDVDDAQMWLGFYVDDDEGTGVSLTGKTGAVPEKTGR